MTATISASAISTAALIGVVVVAALALAYVIVCIVVARGWHRGVAEGLASAPSANATWPSVTVLKPLCGLEPDLEANLCSFRDQTYPAFELMMGVRDNADAALPVASSVARGAGGRARVVVGAHRLGPNQKVNTLARLSAEGHSDVIVVSDSDIRVGPTYLQTIVEPLRDPRVGVVTCLYRGSPTGSLWSKFAAMAINEWFWPSVLVSRIFGSERYCSGATMAVRREVLEAIGGFETLAPILADDHELGARIRQLGFRSVVSHYEVTTSVDEPSLTALFHHELRWMRTIRTLEPWGHACSIVTYTLPTTLLALMFVSRHAWLVALPILALVLRLTLHWVVSRGPAPIGAERSERRVTFGASAWMVPIRDVMSFCVWVASFANREVVWRQQSLHVNRDGVLRARGEAMPA